MIIFDICFDERIKRDFFSKEYGIAECGNLTFKDDYSLYRNQKRFCEAYMSSWYVLCDKKFASKVF